MYIRPVHAEHDQQILWSFIKANPLGLLTTSIRGDSFHQIQTSHIPFVLDQPSSSEDSKDLGTLRGHLARANPQSKAIIQSLQKQGSNDLSDEVLVLFNSPHQHYITPKYYVESKPKDGKVVPTFNYSAVQVYGSAKVFYEAGEDSTSTFLGQQIRDLSNNEERRLIEQEELLNGIEDTKLEEGEEKGKSWEVEEAPVKYIELLKKAIIGIEIRISSIEGRFKLSQEMGQKDREGVVKGLTELRTDKAKGVAKGVEKNGK